MNVKIKLNEKKEIKIPNLSFGDSIKFKNSFSALNISEKTNDTFELEVFSKNLNNKILNYEIRDNDDNLKEQGGIKVYIDNDDIEEEVIDLYQVKEIIGDEDGTFTSLINHKESEIQEEYIKEVEDEIIYPKNKEIECGKIDVIRIEGLNKSFVVEWSSYDFKNLDEIITMENNGQVITINTKNLDLGVYSLEFKINKLKSYSFYFRVIQTKNLINENEIEPNNDLIIEESNIEINSYLTPEKEFENKEIEDEKEKNKDFEVKEKEKEKIEPLKKMPEHLTIEVFKDKRLIYDLCKELKNDSIIIGKTSIGSKKNDIDLINILESSDKCSRNQLKIFRNLEGVMLINIGNHRVRVHDSELFPKEYRYLDLDDEIFIGSKIKIKLREII
jgi:hypothetical protein